MNTVSYFILAALGVFGVLTVIVIAQSIARRATDVTIKQWTLVEDERLSHRIRGLEERWKYIDSQNLTLQDSKVSLTTQVAELRAELKRMDSEKHRESEAVLGRARSEAEEVLARAAREAAMVRRKAGAPGAPGAPGAQEAREAVTAAQAVVEAVAESAEQADASVEASKRV